MVTEVKFTCLSCNTEIGRGLANTTPPVKCRFCGGVKIGTSPLVYEDRKSMDYDIIVLNKGTGKDIKAGFTISPKEYVGADGTKLKTIFALRLSEALAKSLTQKTVYELIEDGRR